MTKLRKTIEIEVEIALSPNSAARIVNYANAANDFLFHAVYSISRAPKPAPNPNKYYGPLCRTPSRRYAVDDH